MADETDRRANRDTSETQKGEVDQRKASRDIHRKDKDGRVKDRLTKMESDGDEMWVDVEGQRGDKWQEVRRRGKLKETALTPNTSSACCSSTSHACSWSRVSACFRMRDISPADACACKMVCSAARVLRKSMSISVIQVGEGRDENATGG
jgi:hypothetical protein